MTFDLTEDELRRVASGAGDIEEILDGLRAAFHYEKQQILEHVPGIVHTG